MNILEATRSYETWLAAQTAVVACDLRRKKELMADGPFPFFRGTFFRWAQLWPEHCPELGDAPDCVRISAADFRNGTGEPLLLNAMGRETANVHLGTRKSRGAVLAHLRGLGDESLFAAAQRLVQIVEAEGERFRAETN
ncbi:MAG: hypothetical protein JOZ02_17585 [Acidobacteria bacterium]|nr:hypothetical protein [Acidobacteriota bacterium]